MCFISFSCLSRCVCVFLLCLISFSCSLLFLNRRQFLLIVPAPLVCLVAEPLLLVVAVSFFSVLVYDGFFPMPTIEIHGCHIGIAWLPMETLRPCTTIGVPQSHMSVTPVCACFKCNTATPQQAKQLGQQAHTP